MIFAESAEIKSLRSLFVARSLRRKNRFARISQLMVLGWLAGWHDWPAFCTCTASTGTLRQPLSNRLLPLWSGPVLVGVGCASDRMLVAVASNSGFSNTWRLVSVSDSASDHFVNQSKIKFARHVRYANIRRRRLSFGQPSRAMQLNVSHSASSGSSCSRYFVLYIIILV